MSRLTIVRNTTPTVSVENLTLYEYEIVETGEIFFSLTDDTATAFACYINNRQVEDSLMANLNETELAESTTGCEEKVEDREGETEKEFLLTYAKVLAEDVHDLVQIHCEACEIFDGSQDHHDCLMLENDERVYRYLEEALKNVDDEKVFKTFLKNVEKMALNELEESKYCCKENRKAILVNKREVLEDLVIKNM